MTGFPRLGALRDHYDILYCDVWGVIRDGKALLPEAVEALQAYRRSGGAAWTACATRGTAWSDKA